MIGRSYIGARLASRLSALCLPAGAGEWGKGVYIGKSSVYNLPVRIDVNAYVNPHMVVLGSSGAGKSFFIKAYAARCVALGRSILILDWNAEYAQLVRDLLGNVYTLRPSEGTGEGIPEIGKLSAGLNCVDMSLLRNDAERSSCISGILERLIEAMHSGRIRDWNLVLVLDEAWRASGAYPLLGRLFREGRKYGIAAIASSQLQMDVNAEVLLNAACWVLLRQDPPAGGPSSQFQDLGLDALPVGGCVIMAAFKGGEARKAVRVPLVAGADTARISVCCGSMTVTISSKRFSELTARHIADTATAQEIVASTLQEKRVDLLGLAGILRSKGVPRSVIVPYFRALGVQDMAIVQALCQGGKSPVLACDPNG